MVKKILLIFLLSSQLFALSSLELAKNIVNNSSKKTQLELLFSGQSYTDSNGNLDIDKISRILKTNSLLNLALKNSQSLRLNFKAKADAVLFFKIINDALNDAGYVYFIPTDLLLKDGEIDYTIQVESQYILDPGTFYTLLKSNSVYIKDIKRVGSYDYEYNLDFNKAQLKTNIDLDLNVPKSLEKPLKDYVLSLKNASSLAIEANEADNWFPKVLFLDKNLNLIKGVKSEVKNNEFLETIPSGAVYAIISDMYSLDNIRRGLKITLKR